ncbi:MAG: 2-C-methyl-D-erythritol 4-phosphate cytidylyltransferase [Polaromonas sp.]|nr:2-C-methyl-D-erythritol 4-phosphate cytidylyltransferase [Polaromonas sp.]
MTTVDTKPRFFALIPCAGSGNRAGAGSAKQYQLLAGRAMVWHTLQAFRVLPALAGIWVVTAPHDMGFSRACPDFNLPGEKVIAVGGATRAASVCNGLKALLDQSDQNESKAGPDDWVLVHDAARCLVTPAQINDLIEACQNDTVGGLLALPLPDTLKSSAAGRVAATVVRVDKWLAQTPQMFRIGALLNALEAVQAAGLAVTDESGAMEAQGLLPLLVPGSAQNFKVTYPEDFALAQAVLESRIKVSQ